MGNFFEDLEKQKQDIQKQKEIEDSETSAELLLKLQEAETKQEGKKRAEELQEQIYSKAIANIRISESIRVKVNKNSFEDKDMIIDMLLYIVGKMTQDSLFYNINITKLKDHAPIYKD